MDRNKKHRLTAIGVVLMLGLPVIPLVVGVIVYEFPRYYFSKSTVEIHPKTPPPVFNPTTARYLPEVAAAMAPFGRAAEYKSVRQTDLYELGIWDRDPSEAARKANEAAAALQRNSDFRVKIWENAEPALAPGRPRVFWYILPAVALGILSFGAGAILLVVALVSSRGGPEAALQT